MFKPVVREKNWFEYLSLDQNKQLCKAAGLRYGGTKKDMIERLLDYEPTAIFVRAPLFHMHVADWIKRLCRVRNLSDKGEQFDLLLRILHCDNGTTPEGTPRKRVATQIDSEVDSAARQVEEQHVTKKQKKEVTAASRPYTRSQKKIELESIKAVGGQEKSKGHTLIKENVKNDERSVESLFAELFNFCGSKSLSEDGLRETIVRRHGFTPSDKLELSSNENDKCHRSSLHVVCQNESVTEGIIRCLLAYFPAAASVTDRNGLVPLHYACWNTSATLNIIRLLIEAAPDSVRIKDNQGWMPLHALCANRTVDEATAIQILKLLIEKCPEAVQHTTNVGGLPIHLASGRRSPGFCRVLIEAYPGSERISVRDGVLPLHLACTEGTIATVEYLLRLDPEAIDHTTTDGSYPIHCAIDGIKHRDNLIETVKFLLKRDPNVKLQQYKGMSLLHYVCQKKYNDSNVEVGIQIIKVIFDAHPASVCSLDNFGAMPLQSLCSNEKVDQQAAMQILKLLLEKHPEAVRHANNHGSLPIHSAAGRQSPEFCRVLVEAYPGSERISVANGIGALPLHLACSRNTVDAVEYFCKLYPEAINHATSKDHCPIHYAIWNHRARDGSVAALDIMQFLFDYDPNVKLQKYRGRSLLRYACRGTYNDSNIEAALEIIKTIYDAHPKTIGAIVASSIQHYHQQVQAFINGELVYVRQAKDRRLMITPDDNGQLPLHAALQSNATLGSIKLLVKGNPSAVRSTDNNLATPLHIACEHHDSACVVQYLIDHHTLALEAVDRQGDTALHYACRRAKYDTIELLIGKYDAVSISKLNAQNKLPIELLWESNAVGDRESVGYMESVFRLLKAYPEMIML